MKSLANVNRRGRLAGEMMSVKHFTTQCLTELACRVSSSRHTSKIFNVRVGVFASIGSESSHLCSLRDILVVAAQPISSLRATSIHP